MGHAQKVNRTGYADTNDTTPLFTEMHRVLEFQEKRLL